MLNVVNVMEIDAARIWFFFLSGQMMLYACLSSVFTLSLLFPPVAGVGFESSPITVKPDVCYGDWEFVLLSKMCIYVVLILLWLNVCIQSTCNKPKHEES